MPVLAGSGAGTIFDPSSLSLTLWLRADYASSPWPGTASAGTSGSNSATEATHPPTVGTAVNGKNPAAFTTNQLISPAGTLGTYVSTSAGSGWALVNLTSLGGAGAAFSHGALFASATSGYYAIEPQLGTGVLFTIWDGAAKTASRALSTGSYALVTWRHNGSLVQVGVNEAPGAAGGASSLAGGNVQSVANNVVVGTNASANAFLTGAIADLGVSNTALTDGNFASIKAYVNTRYGLAL